MRIHTRHAVLALAVAIVVFGTACSADDAAPTDTPPTDAALEANAAFTTAPEGVLDCGSVALSSGWPTTTVFIAYGAGTCILEAVDDGTPAQQAYWQRDNEGGIVGSLVRVDGPSAITETSYTIDANGDLESATVTCSGLDVPNTGPPSCAA